MRKDISMTITLRMRFLDRIIGQTKWQGRNFIVLAREAMNVKSSNGFKNGRVSRKVEISAVSQVCTY